MKQAIFDGIFATFVVLVCVALSFKFAEVKQLLPEVMHLNVNDYPAQFLQNKLLYNESERPSLFLNSPVNIDVGPLGFMLIVSPILEIYEEYNTTAVYDWYNDNREWFDKNMVMYGGILLRGFNIPDVFTFDEFVATIHAESNGTGIYLGTAPRQKIPNTRFVSTASDIPRAITIPTHLELPFTPNPPKRLYFFVEQPNKPPGGQTPFTDFRAVWEDLPVSLRDKFVRKGLMYERRYYSDLNTRPLDPLQTKSWQNMFQTRNKTEAELLARQQEFQTIWDERDNLLLRHLAVVNRTHSDSGRPYWSTHFNVLHAPTYAVPYAWSAQLFQSKQSALIALAFHLLLSLRQAMGCPYGHNMVFADDGLEVSWEEALVVRRAVSRRTWLFDWQKGDMLLLDNHRVAHGRSPYFEGDRKVFVAWN